MAERKPFLLRLTPETHAALQRWADDDLRSLNGQIEFLLRQALVATRRVGEGSGETGQAGIRSASVAANGGPDGGTGESKDLKSADE